MRKSERVERRKEAQNPGPSFPTSFHKIRQFQVSIEMTVYIYQDSEIATLYFWYIQFFPD